MFVEEDTMGHYAAEMASDAGIALRRKYYAARKKLEDIPASGLTVGQLMDIFEQLDSKRTPRDFEGVHAKTHVGDRITEINRLFAKITR